MCADEAAVGYITAARTGNFMFVYEGDSVRALLPCADALGEAAKLIGR